MKKLFIITAFMLYTIAANVLNAQILSVTPDTVTQGEKLDIEVTAENINFSQGTNIVYLKHGSTEFIVSHSTVKSASTLAFNYTFTSNNPFGYYDLRIWNSSQTLTKSNAIYVTRNTTITSLESIVPDTGSQGENVTITLHGTNTNFDKAGVSNSVYLSNGFIQIFALATNPIDAVTLEAQFNFDYTSPYGLYSISVNNTSDGEITLSNAFGLLKGPDHPAILTLYPDTVTQGQTHDIEVTGENTDFTQGTNIVTLAQGNTGFYSPNATVNSATSLTINQSFNIHYPIGYYNLSIYNTARGMGLIKDSAIFVKPDLTIASLKNIEPDTACQGENVTIILHGTNTNFNKAGVSNSVYLSNSYIKIFALATIPIDSVTLEAQFNFDYAHPSGLYSIFLNNTTDGIITSPNAFRLLKGPLSPTILTINPDTVTQSETLDIEVTAEKIDFTQGTNVVYFEQGNTVFYASDLTINSATSLTINQSFNIDYPIGYYNLSIFNTAADITLSKNNAIYVKPDLTRALIDSITPKTALQGENIIMTVYGRNTNFDKVGVINAVYLKNGYRQINAKTTNPIDSLTLEAEFELTYAQAIGFYSINVNNISDGTLTKPEAFRLLAGVNAPAILSVTPDTLDADQKLDIDIEVTAENIDFTQGTNVVSLVQGNTVIYMNSSSANSPTSLSANFTLSYSAPPGNYNLSIWNTSFNIMLVADQTLVKEKAFYLKSAVVIKLNSIREDKTYFYPNPSKDFLYMNQKYELLQLFDLKGRKILEAKHEDSMDVSSLQKGIYILKLKMGNDFIIKKLIKE